MSKKSRFIAKTALCAIFALSVRGCYKDSQKERDLNPDGSVIIENADFLGKRPATKNDPGGSTYLLHTNKGDIVHECTKSDKDSCDLQFDGRYNMRVKGSDWWIAKKLWGEQVKTTTITESNTLRYEKKPVF